MFDLCSRLHHLFKFQYLSTSPLTNHIYSSPSSPRSKANSAPSPNLFKPSSRHSISQRQHTICVFQNQHMICYSVSRWISHVSSSQHTTGTQDTVRSTDYLIPRRPFIFLKLSFKAPLISTTNHSYYHLYAWNWYFMIQPDGRVDSWTFCRAWILQILGSNKNIYDFSQRIQQRQEYYRSLWLFFIYIALS